MLVAVLTDYFFGEIRLTDFDIFTIARRCHCEDITITLNLKAESAENIKNILCRNLDAEDLIDAA